MTEIENQKEKLKQFIEEWHNAAVCLGEHLAVVGPDGYYNFTAEQWFKWSREKANELLAKASAYDSLKAVAERMNKALNNDCYCEISPKECDYCIEKREIRAAYRQHAEGRGEEKA